MATLKYPRKVFLADLTVREGFQHEEKAIPLQAKLWVVEQLVPAGFKRLEVTNLGTPVGMPQFADADQLLQGIHNSKVLKDRLQDVQLSAVTIRERAADRAIEARRQSFSVYSVSLW